MKISNPDWRLDSRLQADTMAVLENSEYVVVLMNDSRWPWLIVVPKVPGAEELHDLDQTRRTAVMDHATLLGERLKAMTQCDKINIAAIGNIVRQLHIHVIARIEGDPNWPAPVWGYGKAEKYDDTQATELIAQLKEKLFDPPLS